MSDRTRRGRRVERHRFVLVLLSLLLLVVTARILYLQVYIAPAYAERAESQRTRELELTPKRGSILDRSGDPLAVSLEARTVYANPRLVDDATATAEALAVVLGGQPADYARRLTKDAGFVYLERKVDMQRASAVEGLSLKGVSLLPDSRRTYPCGELAAQVLGFVGVDDAGLSGLEQQYDYLLAGEPGFVLAERDPFGRVLPGGVLHSEDPIDGHDIVLTIDKDIQYAAQVELQAAVEQWSATSGSIVVMDPRNGEILAMASVPGFDPNRFGEADEASRRNRVIADVYEPGSTVKSLTAAAVIDAGLHAPDDVFELPPTIKVGGRTIKEAHPRPTAHWTLTEIVTNSSNVGSVLLGLALGPDRLYEYFERFGLTEKTGVDFPGEALGYLPPVAQWSGSSIGNIPFGQGLSMTQLQLARALSAIANGGSMPTPHFILAVPGREDVSFAHPTEQVISPQAAAATREIMKAAVSDGTGSAAAVAGYEVAGKTGTAQKARTDGRGYAQGAYIGSFSGFIPADDPRVLIIVSIDEPKGAIYGGVVAAPVFREVARFAVSHLRIPPRSTSPVPSDAETVTVAPGAE